jgi:hypothetical protein
MGGQFPIEGRLNVKLYQHLGNRRTTLLGISPVSVHMVYSPGGYKEGQLSMSRNQHIHQDRSRFYQLCHPNGFTLFGAHRQVLFLPFRQPSLCSVPRIQVPTLTPDSQDCTSVFYYRTPFHPL